ncbi:MAG: DUF4124 domain-containing protein [Phycisphaerales bacterium]|nr:DUF4124 domain-containing protein [Phycisphaerales bacterium]
MKIFVGRGDFDMKKIVIAFAFCMAAPAFSQTVYKCSKPDGTTAFSQTPCGDEAEAMQVKPMPMTGLGGDLTPGQKAMVQSYNHRIDAEKGQVRVGMTMEEVRRSWGSPDKKNTSFVAGHSHEQWVYRRGSVQSQYLYFEDGMLTSWN